ncbi:hypothetical protein Tco_0991190 [Tanacetum coccineum]|uniref:Uncharacterized protein n=1 Tax=Tanacetum coccineum TaxID=301880 RepID=A0ABQ5EYJ6_9ASTR
MIADLMKKFPNIPQRVDEDYHSIKDDTLLVSMYTTGNVLVRGMLIPDEFLTEEICVTNDFKEYKMVFIGVDVPMNQPQLVVSTQGTHTSTLRAHRTPTVSTASEKDDDDSEDRLEPGSHKENPKYVDDDDDEEKVDEEKDVDMGSLETRTEEMQTPIPTPPRSTSINLSSNKNITQELTNTVSLPTATTSKTPHSKRCISKVHDLVYQEFNAQEPKIIEELFKNYVQRNVIKVHPTITTSTETTSSADQDDAPPEGEKRVKRHKALKSSKSARGSLSKHSAKDSTTYVSKKQQQHEWDAWVEETFIDDDEVIPEDETPELIT